MKTEDFEFDYSSRQLSRQLAIIFGSFEFDDDEKRLLSVALIRDAFHCVHDVGYGDCRRGYEWRLDENCIDGYTIIKNESEDKTNE